jgi:ATP-dependent Clp protease adaptor protein ClpS
MGETETPLLLPAMVEKKESKTDRSLEPGYLVICWDDPINLMDYVTHVFQKVFGWPKPKAEEHMLQVHQQGKSVLVRENLERAEHYVHQLHSYSLHATLERDQ